MTEGVQICGNLFGKSEGCISKSLSQLLGLSKTYCGGLYVVMVTTKPT